MDKPLCDPWPMRRQTYTFTLAKEQSVYGILCNPTLSTKRLLMGLRMHMAESISWYRPRRHKPMNFPVNSQVQV